MKTKKMITVSIILLVSIILIFITPFKTALVFYQENTNKIEAFLPIDSSETFQIVFKHSIHLTDVVEKYYVTADLEIEQTEIIFEEFGIGMPSNAEGEEKFEYKDGKYHISNLNNVFESMNIRNGKTVSEHRLIWESESDDVTVEKRIEFNEYFEPGAWFTVKVEKISLMQYLKGVKIDER